VDSEQERVFADSMATLNSVANEHSKDEKPLKPYRSHAERVALTQRNIQIGLTATNVIVACLTCLKVFGIV
jgi:hypothetical protein